MRRLLLAAVVLALTSPAAAVSADRPDFLTLVRGTDYEMRDDAAKVHVSVPVTLSAGVHMDEIRATVVSVSLGQREDLGLVDAFTATPQRAAKGHGPRLDIAVGTDPGLEPGTYNLIVDVRRTGHVKRGQRRKQRLKLALAHVAATLRAPPTIVVNHTGGFLFIDEKTDARPLRLTETSRRTRISDIEVAQIDGPTGSEITSGELTFKEVPDVGPGEHSTAPPTPSGDFPRGSSSGTLQVDAPQLAAPITVAFEVQDELHWFWLVVIIAAGIVAGYLMRHVLAGIIARNQAREPGYALLDAIAVEYERRRDKSFRDTIGGIQTELETTLQSERNPTTIDTAVGDARTKLKTAVSDLDTERDAIQAQFSALTTTIRTRWTAPKEISDALSGPADELDKARRALDAYNVTRASEILEECRATIDTALSDKARPWAEAVRNFLATLDQAGLPSPIMGEVKVARTEIEAALASSGIYRPSIEPETVMEGVHTAETRLRRLLAEDLSRMTLAVAAVVEALASRNPDLDAVTHAETQLVEALREGSTSADDLATIAERASNLAEALRNACENVVPTKDAAARRSVEAKLDRGLYVDAARVAVEAARKQTKDPLMGVQSGAAAVGSGTGGGDAELAMFGRRSGVAPAAMPGLVVQAAGALRGSAFDLTRARAASRAALADASLLRAAIIGVFVVLVGLGLFLPTFTGTFDQILAALLWGFAADVTSEGLYQLAKSSSSPAAMPTAAPAEQK